MLQVKNIGSNMTEVRTIEHTILISYATPVAAWSRGFWYRTEKKWSQTTSRHIKKWLAGRTAHEKPQEFFDTLLNNPASYPVDQAA